MHENNTIIASVTFVLFFFEALMHYNIGLYQSTRKLEFHFPTGRALLKIIGVLLVFCVLNALVTSYFIERAANHANAQPAHAHYESSPLDLVQSATPSGEPLHVHL